MRSKDLPCRICGSLIWTTSKTGLCLKCFNNRFKLQGEWRSCDHPRPEGTTARNCPICHREYCQRYHREHAERLRAQAKARWRRRVELAGG